MIGEGFRPHAQLVAALFRASGGVCRYKADVRAFARSTFLAMRRQAVGFIIGTALGHHRLHFSVPLEIAERTARCVYRDLMEVGGAET